MSNGRVAAFGCWCHKGLSRRRLLASAAGALAASALPVQGQTVAAGGIIDVHHHISPPAWLSAVQAAKLANPPMTDWTPQRSIEQMDAAGIATSVTSPTNPQVSFLGAADAAAVARASNEYAARLAADHKGRFGTFAMLPLPHIEPSLAEIAYALDVLKADGIGMLTSYGQRWLGDPAFAPVFEELNRRRATVYTHPASPACCVNLVPGVPDANIEFGTDTARTIAELIFGGASRRYPDIAFIFSHGGGALTAVVERFEIKMPNEPPHKGKITRETVDHELNRFYYDTAQIANAVTVEALAKIVPMSQIVFGSDYPYRTPLEHVQGLAQRFDAKDLAAIERANPLRILPRLGAV